MKYGVCPQVAVTARRRERAHLGANSSSQRVRKKYRNVASLKLGSRVPGRRRQTARSDATNGGKGAMASPTDRELTSQSNFSFWRTRGRF